MGSSLGIILPKWQAIQVGKMYHAVFSWWGIYTAS